MNKCCREMASKIYGGYKGYLKSDNWRKKRKQRLELDDYICQHHNCDDKATHVHHLNYNTLYDEDMEDLVSLCEYCHAEKHGRTDQFWAEVYNRIKDTL